MKLISNEQFNEQFKKNQNPGKCKTTGALLQRDNIRFPWLFFPSENLLPLCQTQDFTGYRISGVTERIWTGAVLGDFRANCGKLVTDWSEKWTPRAPEIHRSCLFIKGCRMKAVENGNGFPFWWLSSDPERGVRELDHILWLISILKWYGTDLLQGNYCKHCSFFDPPLFLYEA